MAKKRSVEEPSTSRNLEFSSSEDEFDVFEKENGRNIVDEDESDDYDSSDSVLLPKKKRVMPIADSDSDDELSENENTNGDSDESSEWENVTERDDIFQQIKFTVSPKVTGPQISPNIIEPIDIFKLFFTDELVDNIIKETNNYANTKISAKRLTKRFGIIGKT